MEGGSSRESMGDIPSQSDYRYRSNDGVDTESNSTADEQETDHSGDESEGGSIDFLNQRISKNKRALSLPTTTTPRR
jgi:hypothetical protein